MEPYRIELQCVLNENWADWLSNLEMTNNAADHTLLSGEVVDQSALHGLLARIRDLGVPIASIERLPITTEPANLNSEEVKMRTTIATASLVTNWNFGRILRIGAPTTLGAMVVNALCAAVGNLPKDIVPPAAVLSVTFMGGLAAIIGYALLNRFLTQKTTSSAMFAGIALVLIGFAYNPFTIPNVSMTTFVILQIMHIVAALPAVGLARHTT